MNLTLNRAYNSNLGRWIKRDPIGEDSGVNLHAYVDNNPTGLIDPSGLDSTCQRLKSQQPKFDTPLLKGGISSWSGPPQQVNGSPTQPGLPAVPNDGGDFMSPSVTSVPPTEGAYPDPILFDIIVTLYPLGRLVRSVTSVIPKGTNVAITFGHGARHATALGQDATVVETTISQAIKDQAATDAKFTDSFWGEVGVNGTRYEYRAMPREGVL